MAAFVGGKAVVRRLYNLAASSRRSPPSLSLGRSCLKNACGPCIRVSILATHTSVFRRIFELCAVGISIGTIITLAAGGLLSAVLYGVSPRDPATYAIALLLMLFVALLASWNPAARAIRIDPARPLREQ